MKNKKKIYIFDLDHTLFDARSFRIALSEYLFGEEVESERVWEFYEKNKEKVSNFIENKAKGGLFPGVLENIDKLEDEKILLTYGPLDFQKVKVQALNFDKIFDRVFLTDKNKIEFLKSFVNENQDKEIVFINDNYNKRFQENKQIEKELPRIKIIEIDNYQNKGLRIGDFLKEII